VILKLVAPISWIGGSSSFTVNAEAKQQVDRERTSRLGLSGESKVQSDAGQDLRLVRKGGNYVSIELNFSRKRSTTFLPSYHELGTQLHPSAITIY